MSNPHHQLKGSLLIDPTLREFIHRSQLWKHHVANNSLKWIVAKVGYADTLGKAAKERGEAVTMAMGAVGADGAPAAGSGGGAAVSWLGTQLKTAATASAVKTRVHDAPKRARDGSSSDDDEDEGASGDNAAAANAHQQQQTAVASDELLASMYYAVAPTSSTAVQGIPTGIDRPIHRPPHIVYAATFHEIVSASYMAAAAAGGGGAAAAATSSAAVGKPSGNPLLNGDITLRPELFLCCLYRTLQLSKDINSLQVVEMVEQTTAPRSVTHTPTATATLSDGEEATASSFNVNGSKYLRVFGLFLARMLLAQRGEPLLLKRCYEAAKTDFRRVRVMKKKIVTATGPEGGGDAITTTTTQMPVTVMRVDEVAYMLFTTDRWDRIVFPPCKTPMWVE